MNEPEKPDLDEHDKRDDTTSADIPEHMKPENLEKLRDYIRSCDAVICLIGDGYGAEPSPDAVATIGACGGFAAVSGSSVATAAGGRTPSNCQPNSSAAAGPHTRPWHGPIPARVRSFSASSVSRLNPSC